MRPTSPPISRTTCFHLLRKAFPLTHPLRSIVGALASSKYQAFRTACFFAHEYSILAASLEDRPAVPTGTVVLAGIPRALCHAFRKWDDVVTPTKAGPNGGVTTVSLSAALEAAGLDQ